jgi:hypothetical protein
MASEDASSGLSNIMLQQWELDEEGIRLKDAQPRKKIVDAVNRFKRSIRRRSETGYDGERKYAGPPSEEVSRLRVAWKPVRAYDKPWLTVYDDAYVQGVSQGALSREQKALADFLERKRKARLTKAKRGNALALRVDDHFETEVKRLEKEEERMERLSEVQRERLHAKIAAARSTRSDTDEATRVLDEALANQGGEKEQDFFADARTRWNSDSTFKRERVLMHQILSKTDLGTHQPEVYAEPPACKPPLDDWRSEVRKRLAEDGSDALTPAPQASPRAAQPTKAYDADGARLVQSRFPKKREPVNGPSASQRQLASKLKEYARISAAVESTVLTSEQAGEDSEPSIDAHGRKRITKGTAKLTNPLAMTRSQRRIRDMENAKIEARRAQKKKEAKLRAAGKDRDPNYWGLYNRDPREVIYRDIQRHIRHEVALASDEPGRMDTSKILGRAKTRRGVEDWLRRRKRNMHVKHVRQMGAWVPSLNNDSETSEHVSPAEQKRRSTQRYLQALLHRQTTSREERMKGWTATLGRDRARAERHEVLARVDLKKKAMEAYVAGAHIDRRFRRDKASKDRKKQAWSKRS